METLGQKVQDTHQQRITELERQAKHDQVIEGLDRVQKSVIASGLHHIKAIEVHKPEVTVLNPVDTVSTPDVKEVVTSVNELIKLEKGRKGADLKPIIKQLVRIVPILEELPSKIVIPEGKEEVQVTNFDELTVILEDILLSLKAQAEREANEPPVVIPAPVVNVSEHELDLTPLQADLQDIRAAVDNIKIPEIPVDDDTEIIKGLYDVSETIKNLRFPIPNVATDPLIRYKIADVDDAGTVKYFGQLTNEGSWLILKEDDTNPVKTFRYAAGSHDYPTAWTNRATQTYSYLSEALY